MNRRTFLVGTTLLATAQASTLLTPLASMKSTQQPSSVSLDRSRLLDCLAQVESARNDQAVATRLNTPIARGRYQITEPVWFQHTNRPWKLAHNFHFATIVAERHLATLEKLVNPNPADLAAAWRYGPNSPWPVNTEWFQADDYPWRVHNLYYEAKRIT